MEKECPKCKKQMMLGFQYNYAFPVQWIPLNSEPPKRRGTIGKDGIKTGKGSWFSGYIAKSYYCEDCGLIITPVEKEKNK